MTKRDKIESSIRLLHAGAGAISSKVDSSPEEYVRLRESQINSVVDYMMELTNES